MSKWADYLITGVRYNEEHTFIIVAELRKDKGGTVGNPQNRSREFIIYAIENGTTFVTAIESKSGWLKGADVGILTVDDVEYIRTDKNETKRDNLENLPEI